MEVSGPASSAVGRPLTEDEMADVKKEASAGPDCRREPARWEAEAPLERAGAPRRAEFPGAARTALGCGWLVTSERKSVCLLFVDRPSARNVQCPMYQFVYICVY